MEKAVELYTAKKVSHLVTTGGYGRFNRNPESLGQLAKNYLIKRGVKPEDIWVEGKSRNTVENALGSLLIIKEKNIAQVSVVTSADHMIRSMQIFKDLFPKEIKIKFIISDYQISLWDFFWHLGGFAKYQLRKLKLVFSQK